MLSRGVRGPAGSPVAERRTLRHDGRRRAYTLVRPPRPAPGRALILVLHGTAQTGSGIRDFAAGAFDRFAAAGYPVAYPDAVHREWNGARTARMLLRDVKGIDDVGFLAALVADVRDRYGVGPVHPIGYSLGGQMVFRLIHDAPDLIAGAVVLAANLPTPGHITPPRHAPVPLPYLEIHGTDDPLSPYGGGPVGFGWFRRGEHLGAEETAAYFARRNGIDAEPTSLWTGAVRRIDYRQQDRPPVTLYAVSRCGHQIPGASAGPRRVFGRPSRALDTVAVAAEFLGLDLGAAD
ncbi:alpha/beta hydrolase family esterase [Nocardia sp. NPDC003482]